MKLTLNALSPQASVYLNVLRLFAAELVVVSHFITSYRPMALTSFFLGGMLGGVGVFVFFAISGFLISYSLLQKMQNRQYRFRNYLVDRFSRIYSGLLPCMLFTAAIAGAIYLSNNVYFNHLSEIESAPTLQSFLATAVMVEDFPSGPFNVTTHVLFGGAVAPQNVGPFGFNAVLWTLVVEWWIYMFIGWLILGGVGLSGSDKTRAKKAMFLAFGGAFGVVLAVLAWEYSAFILVWFLGALVMVAASSPAVQSKLKNPVAGKVLAALLVLVFAAVVWEGYVIYAVSHESFNLLFGLLVSGCVFLGLLLLNNAHLPHISGVLLRKRVAQTSHGIAAFSYTLFLIHYPLILFLNGLNMDVDRLVMFPLILLLANEVAFCLAYVGEKRHRWLATKIKSSLKIKQ
ncbi:MAG: acyltransferase [Candidatus Bathyarchaeota archaeon]|nr:acyltransferase [Candidatus Bathyarchaeota archaeon]